jgi:hypothetical protein
LSLLQKAVGLDAGLDGGSMPFPVEIDFSTNMTIGGSIAGT